MDIITNTHEMNEYHSAVFDMYFGEMKFAAFDIETTGLSPDRCQLILAGFCSCAAGRCETVQFFAESLSEEAEIIDAALAYMNNFDFLVTYNGRRFDTPFTLRRAQRYGADTRSYPYDLDIYPLVKRFSDIGSFVPNLRQKTLEDFMGLWNTRNDEIDGGQSVRMYYDYLNCRGTQEAERLKEKILLHNHDDVVQLYRLLEVTGRVDLHGAMNRLGFPVGTSRGIFCADRAEVKRGHLYISGRQPGYPAVYINPGDGNISCEFRADGSFIIDVALVMERGLALADLTCLPVSTKHFEHLPSYGSGYLVLDSAFEINLLSQKLIQLAAASM